MAAVIRPMPMPTTCLVDQYLNIGLSGSEQQQQQQPAMDSLGPELESDRRSSCACVSRNFSAGKNPQNSPTTVCFNSNLIFAHKRVLYLTFCLQTRNSKQELHQNKQHTAQMTLAVTISFRI